MAKFSRLKKTIVIAAVGALSIAGAGVAFAYWTSTGTGVGVAQTGEAASFVITAEDAVGEISPGSPGQTIAFTVTNPGPGTLYFGRVTVTIATSATEAWVPPDGCNLSDYTAIITTLPSFSSSDVSGELGQGQSVSGGVATVTMANTSENQDACQGAVVPLWFTADSTPYIV